MPPEVASYPLARVATGPGGAERSCGARPEAERRESGRREDLRAGPPPGAAPSGPAHWAQLRPAERRLFRCAACAPSVTLTQLLPPPDSAARHFRSLRPVGRNKRLGLGPRPVSTSRANWHRRRGPQWPQNPSPSSGPPPHSFGSAGRSSCESAPQVGENFRRLPRIHLGPVLHAAGQSISAGAGAGPSGAALKVNSFGVVAMVMPAPDGPQHCCDWSLCFSAGRNWPPSWPWSQSRAGAGAGAGAEPRAQSPDSGPRSESVARRGHLSRFRFKFSAKCAALAPYRSAPPNGPRRSALGSEPADLTGGSLRPRFTAPSWPSSGPRLPKSRASERTRLGQQ